MEDVIISIDPGVRGCGVSLFVGGQLVAASYVPGIGGHANPLLECANEVVGQIDTWGVTAKNMEEYEMSPIPRANIAVIEVPQIYREAQQKGAQEDLIRLAIVVGTVAHAIEDYCHSILFIEPHDWKGNTPKDISETRTRGKLSPEELQCVEDAGAKQHNTWDAIGIGLWRVGR